MGLEKRETHERYSDSEEEHHILHAEDWATAGAKMCNLESLLSKLRMLPG